VAIGLAAELANRRGTTLIVDVDETTPIVSARLGYRLEPTVLDALERIYYGDGDLSETITQPTQGSRGFTPMHVLAGIANPDDWSLLGRDRCLDLLRRAALQWQQVVAVSGPHLLSLPAGADRFGASQAAVACGDVVVGVCDPTPTGVLLALDWLIEARKLRSALPVWIVFAGRPRSSVQRADLVEALTREAGSELIAGVMFVPMGPEVDRACWEGRVSDKGRFAKSMRALAAELVPATVQRRRKAGKRR
jgi:MinD-like ATPase involved in chromosome partitioning or flagellar assembly